MLPHPHFHPSPPLCLVQHRVEAKQNVDTSQLTIVNKYYSAQLTLTSVGFDADGDGSVLDNAEGYVLVVDGADVRTLHLVPNHFVQY